MTTMMMTHAAVLIGSSFVRGQLVGVPDLVSKRIDDGPSEQIPRERTAKRSDAG
jgi:hypothetical protein